MPSDTTYMLIKATRSDGRSFRNNGEIDYGAKVGQFIEVDAAPFSAGQCARGLHVSPTALDCCRIMGDSERPWRTWHFFELAVAEEDIVWPAVGDIFNENKWRVRRVFVARELAHDDVLVFGWLAKL